MQWDTPEENGAPITCYVLTMKTNMTETVLYKGILLQHVADKLQQNKTYEFLLQAYNKCGVSVGTTTGKTLSGKDFKYSSDGVKNGLFYWLGTNKGTTDYVNPADLGHIGVTSSGVANGVASQAAGTRYSIQSTTTGRGSHTSRNVPRSWFMFDLGHFWIRPTDYTLFRSAPSLRNWHLEGSVDSITWTTLAKHSNCGVECVAVVSWSLRNATEHFRYLRIVQTGVNPSNDNRLLLSGFEVYGSVINHI